MENLKGKKEKPPHPRAHANPLSALTFSWLLGIFVRGFKKELEVEDLCEPLKEHRSDRLGDIFEKQWDRELLSAKKKKQNPNFLTVIVKVFFWRNAMYSAILAVSELGIRLIQPFLIGLLVRYFSIANQNLPVPGCHIKTDNGTETIRPIPDNCTGTEDPMFLGRYLEILDEANSQIQKEEAIFFAGGIILISFINIFVAHPYMMAILHQGMKLRVACCSLIYRKALRLSKTALGETTVGQVVNLLSNDVNRFDIAIIFVHYLWIGPVETVIVSYFMYRVVGWSTFLGVLFLLLLIPLQGFLGKKMSEYRLSTAMRTDERVRLMNEIISGIQVIKMYTWETPFSKLVAHSRKKEIHFIKRSGFGRGILLSFIIFSTRMSMFLTVITYALTGNIVSAEKIFVLTSFYNILKQTMTVFFPAGIAQVAEALISVKRLQNFMLYEEKPQILNVTKDEKLMNGLSMKPPPPGIKFDKAVCKWISDHSDPTLNNLTMTVTPGRLLAVIGPVGSGKSSLLQAVLKELPINSGSLTVNGTISYASQEPWLFAGSVRQNILFGTAYNRHRYLKVIDVCALKRDFELLPYGDRTIVGERGVSLSGGQRARINLARAVYKEADIYLLDDPLSAVDTHVGKHLFDDCVCNFLKSKTVVLVTHQLQYLKNVDQIVILNNGTIEAEGSFDELQSSGLDFAKLLHEPTPAEGEKAVDLKESTPSVHTRRSSISSTISQLTEDGRGDPIEVAEQRSKGSVGLRIYGSYFAACRNWFLVFLMVLLFFLTQISSSVSDYWCSKWSRDEEVNYNNKNMTDEEREWSTYENMYIYSSVTIAMVVVTLIRSFLFFQVCMMASRNLHDDMFSNITRATMRFFHTNPSGRILNRFSKDMGSLDELLPSAMIDCFQIFLALFGIVIMVAAVSPILLAPTCIVAVIFYFLRIVYLKTSRSVKRLEGVTRSPVFSHLSATLQGLTTIRAFNAEEILRHEFDSHQDLHSSAWYIFISSSRAFGFWLDFFCIIYIAVVTFTFLFWDSKSGADAGLAITQSIGLTGMFQWGMRQSAELENQMTSVERVLEYTDVEQEPPLESKPEKRPPPSWPTKGGIEFEKAVLRYDPEGLPVLHGVSFIIKPQEKIGIVGRTGAGKSTLIAALFRLAYSEGKIVIDSVDTCEIGLHELRSKISIIPQEPVLFSGTLRKNLDPFDEYPDWVLWQALEEVELKDVVNETSEGLNAQMSEGGTNFSVGQRQLLCLARAIIRNNRILIMDEATANVDPQTDILIQRTIRRKFSDCTVLTIAHRLNTVMDSDRILVMDAGRAVEFDHPYLLLKHHKSVLYGMVQQTGSATSKKLKSTAKKSYKLMLRREEALRMLQDTSSQCSGSSRSSSPGLDSIVETPLGTEQLDVPNDQ